MGFLRRRNRDDNSSPRERKSGGGGFLGLFRRKKVVSSPRRPVSRIIQESIPTPPKSNLPPVAAKFATSSPNPDNGTLEPHPIHGRLSSRAASPKPPPKDDPIKVKELPSKPNVPAKPKDEPAARNVSDKYDAKIGDFAALDFLTFGTSTDLAAELATPTTEPEPEAAKPATPEGHAATPDSALEPRGTPRLRTSSRASFAASVTPTRTPSRAPSIKGVTAARQSPDLLNQEGHEALADADEGLTSTPPVAGVNLTPRSRTSSMRSSSRQRNLSGVAGQPGLQHKLSASNLGSPSPTGTPISAVSIDGSEGSTPTSPSLGTAKGQLSAHRAPSVLSPDSPVLGQKKREASASSTGTFGAPKAVAAPGHKTAVAASPDTDVFESLTHTPDRVRSGEDSGDSELLGDKLSSEQRLRAANTPSTATFGGLASATFGPSDAGLQSTSALDLGATSGEEILDSPSASERSSHLDSAAASTDSSPVRVRSLVSDIAQPSTRAAPPMSLDALPARDTRDDSPYDDMPTPMPTNTFKMVTPTVPPTEQLVTPLAINDALSPESAYLATPVLATPGAPATETVPTVPVPDVQDEEPTSGVVGVDALAKVSGTADVDPNMSITDVTDDEEPATIHVAERAAKAFGQPSSPSSLAPETPPIEVAGTPGIEVPVADPIAVFGTRMTPSPVTPGGEKAPTPAAAVKAAVPETVQTPPTEVPPASVEAVFGTEVTAKPAEVGAAAAKPALAEAVVDFPKTEVEQVEVLASPAKPAVASVSSTPSRSASRTSSFSRNSSTAYGTPLAKANSRSSTSNGVTGPSPGPHMLRPSRRSTSQPTPQPTGGDPTLDDFMSMFKTVITRDKGVSIRDAARSVSAGHEAGKENVPS